MTGLRYNPRADHLERYGCTKDEWIELRDLGLRMIAEGASSDSTPLRAYQHQRFAAEHRRKIEWKLSLPEWWAIWSESGLWEKRGLGRGYMMCRKGDKGAYEVGNVYIGPGAANLSAAAKQTDLPIGVAYTTKGISKPYRAYCNFLGKQRHLGTFASVEEAEAAYTTARKLDEVVRAEAVATPDIALERIEKVLSKGRVA